METMTQKIAAILGLLARVRKEYRPDKPESARHARIRAIRAIARARDVAYQTVSDTYLRQLKPAIDGTPAFDALVQAWLDGTSDRLTRVLLSHADPGDRALVMRFFAIGS
jgi:hypothetical protein